MVEEQRCLRRADQALPSAQREADTGDGSRSVTLRKRIEDSIRSGQLEELEAIVTTDRRAVRHLVSLSYSLDAVTRERAARGVAVASRHHPKLIANIVRRLIWSMNDESGTNAVSAPDVIRAIAEERPEILIPVLPDLIRLSGDESLHEGLSKALRTIAARHPGEIALCLEKALTERMNEGKVR